MAKTNSRFKRVNDAYQSVRSAQDKAFEEQAQELIESAKRISGKLDAVIEDLKVPYKQPVGFVKE